MRTDVAKGLFSAQKTNPMARDGPVVLGYLFLSRLNTKPMVNNARYDIQQRRVSFSF